MGQLKVKVKHAPSLTKCWARWARSCVDLVWIVLSCQATQAERPDSLTQSKPNLRMVLLHSAQHFWVTEAWITLTFNCPIQISNFFHKTSTVRCPLPAHLIKSMDIEKKFSVDKNFIWAFEGTDYLSPHIKNKRSTEWYAEFEHDLGDTNTFLRLSPIVIYCFQSIVIDLNFYALEFQSIFHYFFNQFFI